MKKSKRLIALALVVSLFVFDLGINNFMALASYADDNVSSETEELAGSTQEALASSIAEDEEENETAAKKPVEEENLSNEEVSFEAETLAAQELSEGSEIQSAEENAAFTLRIYLGEEGEYYKLGDYYIKAPDGSYCHFDSAAGGFASTGVSNFDLLTAAQLQKVTFKTSPSGAASKLDAV